MNHPVCTLHIRGIAASHLIPVLLRETAELGVKGISLNLLIKINVISTIRSSVRVLIRVIERFNELNLLVVKSGIDLCAGLVYSSFQASVLRQTESSVKANSRGAL